MRCVRCYTTNNFNMGAEPFDYITYTFKKKINIE
jgi:hypothetical protein